MLSSSMAHWLAVTFLSVAATVSFAGEHPRLAAKTAIEVVVEKSFYVGEPTARVVVDVAPASLTPGLKAKVVLVTDSGERAAEAAVAGPGPVYVELPLSGLSPESYVVKWQLLAGGKEIAAGEDKLVKLPPAPAGIHITQIDRYRRIILIDGKPYFPMGVFGVFPDSLKQVADAGFNVTLRWKGQTTLKRYDREQSWDSPYNRKTVDTYLDQIQEAGLYAVETPVKLSEEALYHRFRDVPGEYAKGPYWQDKYPIVNKEITPGVVKNARKHPAVIGYYSYDEPDNFYPSTPDHPKHLLMQQGVEEWYQLVKELDPYHAVWTLFAVGIEKVEDWNAWDVAMRDYYIYTDKHMSEVYDHALASSNVSWRRHSPFVYTPLFEKSSGRPTPLSATEQRAQTYLSIAADVKGLFYWDWPAAYAPNWEMLKQMAGEVKELTPVLLERAPVQSHQYATSETEKSVKFLVKNHDGRAYLILVNAEPASVDMSLTLPDGYAGRAKALFGDQDVAIRGGKLKEQLEPYARRVYVLPGGEWPYGGELKATLAVGKVETKRDPRFRPAKQNLVLNSSFEYDHAALPGWPLHWHPNDTVMVSGAAGAKDGVWTPVADEAYHGKRSMRMTKTHPGMANDDHVFNWLVVPGATQRLRYFKKGPHTFSIYLKADRPARVWLMAGWGKYEAIDVTTEWKRYHVTFDQKRTGYSFVRVYLMSEGTLWLDAAQVEPGGKPGAYYATEPR